MLGFLGHIIYSFDSGLALGHNTMHRHIVVPTMCVRLDFHIQLLLYPVVPLEIHSNYIYVRAIGGTHTWLCLCVMFEGDLKLLGLAPSFGPIVVGAIHYRLRSIH